MTEYGCDEISNGDRVFVEGYKNLFNVTIYEKRSYEYLS